MESWFVNSSFVAGGAALIASPIIIHLINRIAVSPCAVCCDGIPASKRTTKTDGRILFEQLLLLLLRILIILALVALIARLILDPSQLALFQGARTHHMVLLDDSGSMRDRLGETTAFEEALKVIKKIAAEGSRRPGTQKLSMLLLSNPEQPFFSQREVDNEFINELDIKLENLKCSHRSLDLVDGLDEAGKLLAEEKATIKHIHVLSDYRKADWENQKAISGAVAALDADDVHCPILSATVANQNKNIAVIRLSGDLHVASADIPVNLKVAVKNFRLECRHRCSARRLPR